MLMFKVAFSLFATMNQSACSTLDRVLNNQSDFDSVLKYMHHWEFAIQQKIIPMLTCPNASHHMSDPETMSLKAQLPYPPIK